MNGKVTDGYRLYLMSYARLLHWKPRHSGGAGIWETRLGESCRATAWGFVSKKPSYYLLTTSLTSAETANHIGTRKFWISFWLEEGWEGWINILIIRPVLVSTYLVLREREASTVTPYIQFGPDRGSLNIGAVEDRVSRVFPWVNVPSSIFPASVGSEFKAASQEAGTVRTPARARGIFLFHYYVG